MPEIVTDLALGFAGSGLALYFAAFWPIPKRLDEWLDRLPAENENIMLVPLLALNVSGWIVALVT